MEHAPVIHLHDDEIEPQVICSPNYLIIKFHPRCDFEALSELLSKRLTESEHRRFVDLWSNDSAERDFRPEDGYLVIS
jgi:hypothetical protein